MANWVTIENNEITGYYDLLPQSWGSVSGLNAAKDDLPFLKSLGWFPVVRQNIDYDTATEEITSFQYEIQQDLVTETPVISQRSQQPIVAAYNPSFEDLKADFMTQLRAQRNQKLAESDYTQLADIQLTLDDAAKNAWITYRQALRDFPTKYIDNDVLNVENVTWPEV